MSLTINELHSLTGDFVAKRKGHLEVMIDIATFSESENGTILPVDDGELRQVQGADDSGPVGPEFPMFVLTGEAAQSARALTAYDDLMGQIGTMKARSDQYFNEAEPGSDEAEKHLRVSNVLKELHRLGEAFRNR